MSVLSSTPTMFIFPERTMWRFGSSYNVSACLSFLFLVWKTCPSHRKPKPHSYSVPWVYLYPAWQVDPFTLKQRDLKRRSIVKFSYLLYATIICVLCPIVICCIKVDTTVLVCALFILGFRVKCILIHYCKKTYSHLLISDGKYTSDGQK